VKLPVEVLQRRPPADRYDAVVVGAGLGGLACAAILARHGMRVAIVDRARRPGGQVQTIAYQGYAVDLAPPLWEATGVRDVLAAAGVRDVALADVPLRDALRIAIVEGGAVRDRPYPLPVPGAVPSPSVLEAVRALYGVPPRVFAALGGIYEELAHASAEQLEAWREARLVDWLADRGLEPVVASAVRRSALLLGASDPESATVAALASRGRWLAAGAAPAHVVAADNPVAGSRGVVQALVDALVEAGGDLRLGTAVVALDVERGRVRALGVQRQEQPFLEEIAAERVVLAVPEDDVLALLPRAIATQLVGRAGTGGGAPSARSALAMAFAFREPPASDPDEPRFPVVRLVPPVASGQVAPDRPAPGTPGAPVTLCWPTAWAPRVAPPGEALLVAHVPLGAEARELADVARSALLVRSAVYDLFPGARDAIAWERQWIRRDWCSESFALPTLSASVPGCENVVLAGSAVAVPSAYATGATASLVSGRAAAERILSPAAGGASS